MLPSGSCPSPAPGLCLSDSLAWGHSEMNTSQPALSQAVASVLTESFGLGGLCSYWNGNCLGVGIVLGSSNLGCWSQGLAGIWREGRQENGRGGGQVLHQVRQGSGRSWERPEAWLPRQQRHGPVSGLPFLPALSVSSIWPQAWLCPPQQPALVPRPGLPLTRSPVASPRGLPGLNQLPSR